MFVGEPWDFLAASEAVDFEHEEVQALSSRFPDGEVPYAKAAFEFVRDEIKHSMDIGETRVPWRASDVLFQGHGLCYAKSHLYVALLRLAGIPSGFCYQRLADGDSFVLHGWTAVQLGEHWVRLDPRGDKPGLRTWFSTDEDIPAYRPQPTAGEVDYPSIYAQPHPDVLAVLQSHDDLNVLGDGNWPKALSDS